MNAGSAEGLLDGTIQKRMRADLQKERTSVACQPLNDFSKEHRLSNVACPMLRPHLRTMKVVTGDGRSERDSSP